MIHWYRVQRSEVSYLLFNYSNINARKWQIGAGLEAQDAKGNLYILTS